MLRLAGRARDLRVELRRPAGHSEQPRPRQWGQRDSDQRRSSHAVAGTGDHGRRHHGRRTGGKQRGLEQRPTGRRRDQPGVGPPLAVPQQSVVRQPGGRVSRVGRRQRGRLGHAGQHVRAQYGGLRVRGGPHGAEPAERLDRQHGPQQHPGGRAQRGDPLRCVQSGRPGQRLQPAGFPRYSGRRGGERRHGPSPQLGCMAHVDGGRLAFGQRRAGFCGPKRGRLPLVRRQSGSQRRRSRLDRLAGPRRTRAAPGGGAGHGRVGVCRAGAQHRVSQHVHRDSCVFGSSPGRAVGRDAAVYRRPLRRGAEDADGLYRCRSCVQRELRHAALSAGRRTWAAQPVDRRRLGQRLERCQSARGLVPARRR